MESFGSKEMLHVRHASCSDRSLSGRLALQDMIVHIPVSRRMARRFVAGETLADAIAAVLNLNDQGMLATLDHLGENVTSEADAIVRGR